MLKSLACNELLFEKNIPLLYFIYLFQNSSHDGAGQQCCYDLAGYLMMTSDNKWGGNPLRNHNLGVLPWNEANKIPSLSHWLSDILPFYPCCLWQDEQSNGCQMYRYVFVQANLDKKVSRQNLTSAFDWVLSWAETADWMMIPKFNSFCGFL